jgi:hypothetical protein
MRKNGRHYLRNEQNVDFEKKILIHDVISKWDVPVCSCFQNISQTHILGDPKYAE